MKKKPKNPHNNFFIKVMSNEQIAINFLQKFLPKHILDIIDLTSLELEATNLYDDTLHVKYCDIMYRVNFINRPGFFLFNLEHQSTGDKLMALRQHIYKLIGAKKVMEDKNLEHLPLVYGITFYHDPNNKKYPYSCELFDLFGPQSSLARELLFGPFKLVDVNDIDDEALIALNEFGYMAYTLKYSRKKGELEPRFERLLPELRALDNYEEGRNYIRILSKYIVSISNNEEYQRVIDSFIANLPKTGDDIMAIRNIYIAEGKLEGKLEGRLEGKHELISFQLQQKFGELSLEQLEQLESLSEAEVLEMSVRLLKADSLEELFPKTKH